MGDRGGGGFVAGFFFGAFVGAAVALLFAPERGEDVRAQIKEKGIELQHLAEDIKADPAKFAADVTAKGRMALDEQRSRFQQAVEEGRRAAARKKDELLSSLSSGEPDEAIDLGEIDA